MPTFQTEYLEIDVYDFLRECSDEEIQELVDELISREIISKQEKNISKLGFLESIFISNLDKLSQVYYQMHSEEVEYIEKLVKKYC
jgi:hypothetical protein